MELDCTVSVSPAESQPPSQPSFDITTDVPPVTLSPPDDDPALQSQLDAVRVLMGVRDQIVQDLATQALKRVHEVQAELRRKARQDIAAGGVEMVLARVAAVVRVDVGTLRGRDRRQHISNRRHIATYLIKRVTDAHSTTVARALGRNHSTVLHSLGLIARRVNTDAAYAAYIRRLEDQITAATSATDEGSCYLGSSPMPAKAA